MTWLYTNCQKHYYKDMLSMIRLRDVPRCFIRASGRMMQAVTMMMRQFPFMNQSLHAEHKTSDSHTAKHTHKQCKTGFFKLYIEQTQYQFCCKIIFGLVPGAGSQIHASIYLPHSINQFFYWQVIENHYNQEVTPKFKFSCTVLFFHRREVWPNGTGLDLFTMKDSFVNYTTFC